MHKRRSGNQKLVSGSVGLLMGAKGHHLSSSESDDWGDEQWVVDCPCGVNYDDGEEMVECDECGVWVHTVCCRVPKGLPTYVCDRCSVNKTLKESEESEVARLLAELPSKTISFEKASIDKIDGDVSLHNNAIEISAEGRAHVHGYPGGDPSFFVGVSQVFCRQLWKYTGYVPKSLKMDRREIPEPHGDVLGMLSDLPDVGEPLVLDYPRNDVSLAAESCHRMAAPIEFGGLRGQVLQSVLVHEAAFKVERHGKHYKLWHKDKVKEENYKDKRAGEECRVYSFSSKKRPMSCSKDHVAEAGECKKMDISPSVDASGKSTSSSA